MFKKFGAKKQELKKQNQQRSTQFRNRELFLKQLQKNMGKKLVLVKESSSNLRPYEI